MTKVKLFVMQVATQQEQEMTSRFGGVGLGQAIIPAPVPLAQLGISVEPLTFLKGKYMLVSESIRVTKAISHEVSSLWRVQSLCTVGSILLAV